MEFEWRMTAPVAVTAPTPGSSTDRWLFAWMASLALCVGASLVWSVAESATTPGTAQADSVSPSARPAVGEAVLPVAIERRSSTSQSPSLSVVIPAENDYLSSRTIPIAGLAFGRPHGPPIRTVHVELVVNGSVVDQTDLHVYSARFAGVVHVPASVERGEVELRVTNPTGRSNQPAVRRFTVVVPAGST